jgi:hypothetical protein
MWGKEKDMEGIRKIEFKEDYYTHKNSKIEVYL